MKLEDMGSIMTDDQFMIHVLSNLTSDNRLQMVLLEKRIGDKSNPLEVDDLRKELNLCYERLCNQSESNNESKENEDMLCLHLSLKGNVAAAEKLITRLSNVDPRGTQVIGQMMESPNFSTLYTVRRQGM
jgi:septum formation topological specificity factor MinE